MSTLPPSRYRVVFAKTTHMRFTGHLDLQRTWERLLRRADLPLHFSQGFHPRPRFNFASALPLGFTGEAEIFELYLTEAISPDALASRLVEHAPPGIRVDSVEVVAAGAPAVQTLVESADYEAKSLDPIDASAVRGRFDEILAADSLPRERRKKRYDLRPLIRELRMREVASSVIIEMSLSAKEGATGRPDEVLLAVDLDPGRFEIVRTCLHLRGA